MKMITQKHTSQPNATLWYFLINAPLVALTIYVHYLMATVGTAGDNFVEHFGLWLLVAFKIIGANLILSVILADFKTTRS